MINRILSNPENLYWFLPLVFILMLSIYEITYRVINSLLMADLEGQRLFLAEEYKVDPSTISEEVLIEAIDATCIWWGNTVLTIVAVIAVIITIIGW